MGGNLGDHVVFWTLAFAPKGLASDLLDVWKVGLRPPQANGAAAALQASSTLGG